jgi:hypothetical protein
LGSLLRSSPVRRSRPAEQNPCIEHSLNDHGSAHDRGGISSVKNGFRRRYGTPREELPGYWLFQNNDRQSNTRRIAAVGFRS